MKKDLSQNFIIRVFRFVICLVALVFFGCIIIKLLKENFLASIEMYPREFREAANISIARCFLEGRNPYYINEGNPIVVNVYGFINPFLAASISRLCNCSILRSFYFLSFTYTLAIIIAVVYEIYSIVGYEELEDVIYYVGASIVAYTITFSAGHISTRPDNLGILVSVIVLMLARRATCCKRIVCLSFLTVLLFYIKPYFFFYFAAVIIYLFLKNRKNGLIYIGSVAGIGMASVILIANVFPLYFTDVVFFEFVENILVKDTAGARSSTPGALFSYSFDQIREILLYYAVLFLAVAFGCVVSMVSNKSKKWYVSKCIEVVNESKIYLISSILALPVLIVMGTNKGAWVSYHMQLMMPGVVIFGMSVIGGLIRTKKIDKLFFTVLLLVAAIFPYYRYGKVDTLDSKEEEEWIRIENVCLDAFDSEKNIYCTPLLNSLLFDRRSYLTNVNGHNYLPSYNIDQIYNGKYREIVDTFFPLLFEANVYAKEHDMSYRDSIQYDYIISDLTLNIERNMEEYEIADVLILHAGTQEWETYIYKRK